MRIQLNDFVVVEVPYFGFCHAYKGDEHHVLIEMKEYDGDEEIETIGEYDLERISFKEALDEAARVSTQLLEKGYLDTRTLSNVYFY